jgi:hypothetical protein
MMDMRSRSKPPRPGKPDDVFEAPGLRMERRGRFTSVQTHRTPEEQKRFIKRVIDSRLQLLAEIEQANQELLELVHKFNSLELLAQVWFRNSVNNPNEYKEYSFDGRAHFPEHLAALELTDSEYELRSVEMPAGEIEKAQQLLENIFSKILFYYAAENLSPDQSGPISRLAELRFDTILHELVVRNPTYHSHHIDLLRELLGKEFVSQWSQRELHFDIVHALNCIQAIEQLIMNRLDERREKARTFAVNLRNYVDEWKRTGRFVGPEDTREIANRIRNMRGKEAKRAITSAAVGWTFYDLHETCSFTSAEVADKAQIDRETAASFLKLFSLQFGSIPRDYQLPQPTNPLRLRPIINFGDKYFCPTIHLLIWAIKPQFEKFLKAGNPEARNSDIKLWQRYQKHRSDLLLQRGLTYFRRLLPHNISHLNLHYTTVEEGIEKGVELDGLVLFDRCAFLIEAKAGELSPSAKRGGQLRMLADLRELVEAPHRQALRAMAYISSVENPTFQLADGQILNLKKDDYKEFFLVTLTLENIDVFTKELYQLRELGIFETDELPWAISIDDLRIIAETIVIPTQFVHYLKWRLHLNQGIRVDAQSELDWLGYYLAEGPKLLSVPAGYDRVALTTYTTEFDDFYLYEQGERTIPAPRPSQFCPPELTTLLSSLEEHHAYGYTIAAGALLSLTFEERKSFALRTQEFRINARRGLLKEEHFIGQETVIILRPPNFGAQDRNAAARAVAEKENKTVVLLETEDGSKVTACGAWEPL